MRLHVVKDGFRDIMSVLEIPGHANDFKVCTILLSKTLVSLNEGAFSEGVADYDICFGAEDLLRNAETEGNCTPSSFWAPIVLAILDLELVILKDAALEMGFRVGRFGTSRQSTDDCKLHG